MLCDCRRVAGGTQQQTQCGHTEPSCDSALLPVGLPLCRRRMYAERLLVASGHMSTQDAAYAPTRLLAQACYPPYPVTLPPPARACDRCNHRNDMTYLHVGDQRGAQVVLVSHCSQWNILKVLPMISLHVMHSLAVCLGPDMHASHARVGNRV